MRGASRFVTLKVKLELKRLDQSAYCQRMNRVAYLNCELKSRDLESRLLIASRLLRAGIPVVIGPVWSLVGNARAKRNIPGCYLFTTSNNAQAKAMMWARDAGHIVIASDEEALPLVNPLKNVTAAAVESCDRFLVDTAAHHDMLIEAFGCAEKFSIAGSARLEAVRCADIEPMKGPPYILFNTGFGVINSVWGNADDALKMMNNSAPITDEDAKALIVAEQNTFDAMRNVLRWLAPRHRTVVRPHPSERAATWRETVSDVEVVEGSAPLPWIKGARLMVHSNSTTGLEAALIGTPTLNLDASPAYGARYVLGQINHTVGSAQTAIETIAAFFRNEIDLMGTKPMDDMFPQHGTKNTAEMIIKALNGAPPLSGPFPWARVEREPQQSAKFSANREEITRSPAMADAPLAAVHELDDSVFLLLAT